MSWEQYYQSNKFSLIIRHHPNLDAIQSNARASLRLDTVSRDFCQSDCVKLVQPSERIDSYELAVQAQACIASNSGLYLQLNSCGISCMRFTDSIVNGFDNVLLTYRVGDIKSMMRSVQNSKDCGDLSISRSAFNYLIKTSID